jgi:hypothetical protein
MKMMGREKMKDEFQRWFKEPDGKLCAVRKMMVVLERKRLEAKARSSRFFWREILKRAAFGLIVVAVFLVLDGNLQSQHANDNALFIDSKGRVGIGTDQPQAPLEVRAPVGSASAIRFGGPAGHAGLVADSVYFGLRDQSDNNRLSILQANGNVGIGKDQPETKLEIAPNQAIKVGSAYLSSGGDYAHLATNEWFDGQKWQTNGPGALVQIHGQNTAFYTHDENGNHVSRMIVNSAGNVGIGTTDPKAALDVKGNAVVSGTINGEDQPLKFTVGDPRDQSRWLAVEKDIEGLCGDDDGCRIKLLMQHEVNDQVRTITEEIYIEQSLVSNNKEPGLRGWTRQSGGGDFEWILDWTGHIYDLCHPWDWFWIKNYQHEYAYGKRGTAYTGQDRYKLSFMSHPHVTATVIIYDR